MKRRKYGRFKLAVACPICHAEVGHRCRRRYSPRCEGARLEAARAHFSGREYFGPIKKDMKMTAQELWDQHRETCPKCHEEFSTTKFCQEGRKLFDAYYDEEWAKEEHR